MCNGSPARLLFIPSVRFKSTGRPSAPASLLGPRIAQDEMTHLDILNSARLNPHQKRRSTPLLCCFMSLSTYSSSSLCSFKLSSETSALLLSFRACLENGNSFPHYFTAVPDCLSLSFFPQRGSDELSMYNSPNSGMSSISGEFVPTTHE